VRGVVASGELPGLLRCEPVQESLLEWTVDMEFPASSRLQQGLEELAERLLNSSRRCISFQVRFPLHFPINPPQVWIRGPRLRHRSAPVTFGGKVCCPLLTTQGWSPTCSLRKVLEQIRKELLESHAEVDVAVSMKRGYPSAPQQLLRLRTPLFPLANAFFREDVRLISTQFASAFLGDLGRLEASDKVGLPVAFADEIYGLGEDLQLPLMFEVKTRLGQKTHCGLFDFVEGLPEDHVLLPRWIMDDLLIQESEVATIRGVDLELIKFVKIQPHSVEFYEAVRRARGDVSQLLTQSLSRFTALTEDTSVPIDICGGRYNVRIVHLEPQAAVRIIDSDVQHDFEFKVDFDPAPDLEDEAATKARQDELIRRQLARRDRLEHERRALEARKAACRSAHYTVLREHARAAAGADDGREGAVELMLRLPGGGQALGHFRDGAPVAALEALALNSPWAESCQPWGLQLLAAYPRRVLSSDDRITREMHRSAVNVREVPVPADDEHFFREAGSQTPACAEEQLALGEEGDVTAPGAADLAAAPPELDEETLERGTRLAFEAQCLLQAGVAPEEARRHAAGEGPPASSGAEVADSTAGWETAPEDEEPPVALQRSKSQEARQIEEVCCFTGRPPEDAAQLLEAAAWDTERAINNALDALG